MKEIKNIQDILKINELKDEYDLEKASLIERKLRLMSEDDPAYKPLRQKALNLIEEYEQKNWSDSEKITDEQIKENDLAEEIVEKEQKFLKKRKELILKKIKEYDMNQQELGELLGHKKSYMSELMNGVSQFTLKDLVIINQIFNIDLKLLVPPFLQNETKEKIRKNITKLNKPRLRLTKEYMRI